VAPINTICVQLLHHFIINNNKIRLNVGVRPHPGT
jgi:hypothetical protein